MNITLKELLTIATDIYHTNYPQAETIFLAGSMVRGEGTSTSDLDLVVIFNTLPCAYRDSYFYKKWPVEAFVHDPQTLNYFFRKVDRPTGIPSLPTMVAEGIEIPMANEMTASLKQLAYSVLNEGPPKWSEQERRNSRYAITDLINDLRAIRSIPEMYATATLLYSALANHYFRSRNIWSAKGKTIPRRLSAVDSKLAKQFCDGFEHLFAQQNPDKVIHIAAEILKHDGGLLFEGHRLEAPKTWRIG